MKASTIVTVVSAVAAVAAAGVAIYSKVKAEKIREEFDECPVEETKDKLDEAVETKETAERAAVTCGIVFALNFAIPVLMYSIYYMHLGIVTHMAVKNKCITFEELIDFANGAVKEVA